MDTVAERTDLRAEAAHLRQVHQESLATLAELRAMIDERQP
jgi:hypothetical protein